MARVTGAAVAAAFGLVAMAPSFVPGTSGPNIRGAAGGSIRAAQPDLASPGASAGIDANSACLVVGLSAFATGAALRRRRARPEVTQAKAEAAGMESGCTPGGPLPTYVRALMDGAAKAKESVAVTKDVMKIKDMFINDEEFLHEMQFVQNVLDTDPLQILYKAENMMKLLKLESTVMPKFITFLAKKRRIVSLKRLCDEYCGSLYLLQSIAPVRCISAQQLTEEQVKTIKEKMKAKIGVSDIKLVCEVDSGMLAGFRLEWGYTDPVSMHAPSDGVDLTLKNYMGKKALLQGVVDDE